MNREAKHDELRLKKEEGKSIDADKDDVNQVGHCEKTSDGNFSGQYAQNEDDLLSFVAKINQVYLATLYKDDVNQVGRGEKTSNGNFSGPLAQNEDDHLSFVATINKVYQATLGCPFSSVS